MKDFLLISPDNTVTRYNDDGTLSDDFSNFKFVSKEELLLYTLAGKRFIHFDINDYKSLLSNIDQSDDVWDLLYYFDDIIRFDDMPEDDLKKLTKKLFIVYKTDRNIIELLCWNSEESFTMSSTVSDCDDVHLHVTPYFIQILFIDG